MGRLMKVEAKRLLLTRSTWGIFAAMVGVVLVGVLQTAIGSEEGKVLWERQGYFLATINMQLFLLVLGAKAATDDFRYGTIVPAVLITPKRSRVVVAKLAVLAGAGFAFAAVGALVITAASWSHLGNGLQATEIRSLAGLVVAGALFSALGGAVGFLVRHQVGAIVGLIVWTIVVSQILGGKLDRFAQYLPGDAGGALAIAPTLRSMLVGGLILMLYVVVGGAVGAIVMQRRDVL